MLQTIRDHTQGWIAGTIITIIIITFALWGIHTYFTAGTDNNTVATVNSVDITKSQLALAYERVHRQVQAQTGSMAALPPQEESLLKQRALQSLIQLQVLKQASYDQDYRVSTTQIENYLEGMPEFQVDGQFSLSRFQEVLAATLLSTGEFLDLIKTSLLIDQPRLGIIFTSFSLPNEVDYTMSLVNQERQVDYLSISQHYFLNQGLVVPASKVTDYYNGHKLQFKSPDQVSIEYLDLSLKNLMMSIHSSDEVLRTFYNENINSYTQPAQWRLAVLQIPLSELATNKEEEDAKNKAQLLLQRMNRGESFVKLASQYPNRRGQQLQGWVTLNQIPADLQKLVSGLTKIDQLSQPVITNQGVIIIKVLDVKEPEAQPFDKVKIKVNEAYARQKAEEQFTGLRDQLSTATYEHPDSLQHAAKLLNLPIQISELFSKDKGGKDISSNKKVRDAAFNDDSLNLMNNRDVIQISPDEVVVIHVKSHIPSTALSIESVYRQIEERLKSEEAERKALELADLIKQKLLSGADPAQLAQSYHLKIGRASCR